MIRVEKSGLKFYQFESFYSNSLVHAVFTRQGGLSPKPWESLNVGSTVGDNPDLVKGNFQKIIQVMGYTSHQVVQVRQIHSARVVVTKNPFETLIKADAIVTDSPGLLLFMRFADCVPVLFYDPVKNVIAIAHAGWKGTVKEVVLKTVQVMIERFGTEASDIMAGIGPSVGPDHYQVGTDVIQEIKATYSDDWGKVLQNDLDGVKLNLWKANEISLIKGGVKNIDIAQICTGCGVKEWYSHRAEKGKTGRFAAVIGLI